MNNKELDVAFSYIKDLDRQISDIEDHLIIAKENLREYIKQVGEKFCLLTIKTNGMYCEKTYTFGAYSWGWEIDNDNIVIRWDNKYRGYTSEEGSWAFPIDYLYHPEKLDAKLSDLDQKAAKEKIEKEKQEYQRKLTLYQNLKKEFEQENS